MSPVYGLLSILPSIICSPPSSPVPSSPSSTSDALNTQLTLANSSSYVPNLRRQRTGERVKTKFFQIKKEDILNIKGWDFVWEEQFENENYETYALCLKDRDEFQGLITFEVKPKDSSVEVITIETAPHNYGKEGVYDGVGGHLLAIAIKKSYELGFEGHIYFTAKTNLINYYKRRVMAIDGEESKRLYKIYILGMEEKENDI